MTEHEIARRVPRYAFAIDAALTDTLNKTQMKVRTTTLGLYGCGVAASKSLAQGTGVKVKLFHRGAEVKALGIVAYVRVDLDMGIAFTEIDRESERILSIWIAELQQSSSRKP
jgi:hypothetical protein